MTKSPVGQPAVRFGVFSLEQSSARTGKSGPRAMCRQRNGQGPSCEAALLGGQAGRGLAGSLPRVWPSHGGGRQADSHPRALLPLRLRHVPTAPSRRPCGRNAPGGGAGWVAAVMPPAALVSASMRRSPAKAQAQRSGGRGRPAQQRGHALARHPKALGDLLHCQAFVV